MKFPLIGILLCCGFFSQAQKCFLDIGSGGGITGAVTVYRITPDGKVLKGGGVSDIKFVAQGRLSKATAKKYLKRVKKIVAATPEFNHPGNMYYTLTYHESDKDNKLIWGEAGQTVPADAKTLFDDLQQSLQGLEFKPVPSNP